MRGPGGLPSQPKLKPDWKPTGAIAGTTGGMDLTTGMAAVGDRIGEQVKRETGEAAGKEAVGKHGPPVLVGTEEEPMAIRLRKPRPSRSCWKS